MPHLEPVDLVLTDPPYNVGINYGEKTNDNLNINEYERNIKEFICLIRAKNYHLAILLGSKTETLLTWWKNIPNAKQIIIRVGASVNTKLNGMRPQYRAMLCTKESLKWWSDLWEDIRFTGEGYFFNEKRYNHPCHAPLAWAKKSIECFTKLNNIILDPFCGIGTVPHACEILNRRWIGIEIEEKYCEIVAKRIENERQQLKLF